MYPRTLPKPPPATLVYGVLVSYLGTLGTLSGNTGINPSPLMLAYQATAF